MKSKQYLYAFAALLLALGIWMILKSRASNDLIKIGAILPMTGDVSTYGVKVRNGAQIAFDEINSSGGINGRKLEFVVEDDGGMPARAVAAAQKLLATKQIKVIIGGVPSSVTLAIAPIAESAKVVLISPASSSPKITQAGSYIYRVYPSDSQEGKRISDEAHHRKYARAAIVVANNDYGKGLQSVISESFLGQSGKIVASEVFQENETEFRSLIPKIPECDVFFIVGYGRSLGAFVRQLRELGRTEQVMSTVNFEDQATIETGSDACNGVIYSSADFDTANPAALLFVKQYNTKYGSDPDVWSAHGYDCARIILNSIKLNQNAPLEVKHYLDTMPVYDGVTGKMRFDQNGDVVKEIKLKTVKNRKFVSLN